MTRRTPGAFCVLGVVLTAVACGNSAPAASPATPPMHALVDEFAGVAVDTGRWAFYAASVAVAQDDGLVVGLAADSANYGGLLFREPHRFAGSSFLVEVSQPATGRPTTETFVGVTTRDQEEFVLITSLADRVEAWYRWRGGSCSDSAHRRKVGGVAYCRLGSIRFDAAGHRFRRLREERGRVVFELSADGETWASPAGWSVKHRFTDPHALHGLLGAGAYAADSHPGPAVFENVNTGLPALPRHVTATRVSAGAVRITWEDRSVNEAGFVVERKLPGEDFVELARVGADVVEYVDDDAGAGTSREYRVRAFNGSGRTGPGRVAALAS